MLVGHNYGLATLLYAPGAGFAVHLIADDLASLNRHRLPISLVSNGLKLFADGLRGSILQVQTRSEVAGRHAVLGRTVGNDASVASIDSNDQIFRGAGSDDRRQLCFSFRLGHRHDLAFVERGGHGLLSCFDSNNASLTVARVSKS